MNGIAKSEIDAATDLYREAKSEINSYLQKAITDASDYEVNNTKEEYLTTKSSEKVDAFENKVKELRSHTIYKSVPTVAIVSPWVPIVEVAIKAIWEINQKAREEGRNKLKQTVVKYMMKNYEEIPVAKRVDK